MADNSVENDGISRKRKHADRVRSWRLANPERWKEIVRKTTEKNKDRIHAANKRWRQENPKRAKAMAAASREKHREKRLAEKRKWSHDNAALRREKANKYRVEHGDELRARARELYAANREKVKAEVAAWRARNPEKVRAGTKAWTFANPEKVRAIYRNKRARKRNAEGSHTADEILALALKQRHRCADCRVSIRKGWHADHIIALAKGGSNWISNIQLLCQRCNCRKQDKDPLEWARVNGRLL